jgi:hypothetical protein
MSNIEIKEKEIKIQKLDEKHDIQEIHGLDHDLNLDDVITIKFKNHPTHEDTISKKYLTISGMLSHALGNDEKTDELELDIDPKVWAKVKEYMVHCGGSNKEIIPYPAKSKKMSENTDEWSATFADNLWNESKKNLYDVLMAANYFDIPCLLHLLCCKVGTVIKGQPWTEIKKLIVPDE